MASQEGTYVCTLSKELQERAARELNEYPETRATCINTLRNKTKTRPDIKFCTDDVFLLRFLRARKFDIDKAFQNLVRYYEIRKEFPRVFENLHPSTVKHVLDQEMVCTLQTKDKNGAFIAINRLGKWEPSKCDYKDIARHSFISGEKMLENEELQIVGSSVILDFADLSPKHGAYLLPSNAKLLMTILQNVLPMRHKGMHYVNTPPLFETGFKIWRAFMSDKMKDRVHLHGSDIASLTEFIPSSSLPCDYGGTLPEMTVQCQKYANEVLSWGDTYTKQNAGYGIIATHDTLGGTVTSANPSGGLVGSFKKLDV
ncbi:alpha-tocopherol transfer protein-like [Glandiceps talaboti]